MRKPTLLIFAVLALLTFGAASCAPSAPAATGDLPARVNAQQAADILAETENAVLLDVREPVEWAQDGRSPDALLISLGELESRLDELDKDDPVVVICRSGNRSRRTMSYG